MSSSPHAPLSPSPSPASDLLDFSDDSSFLAPSAALAASISPMPPGSPFFTTAKPPAPAAVSDDQWGDFQTMAPLPPPAVSQHPLADDNPDPASVARSKSPFPAFASDDPFSFLTSGPKFAPINTPHIPVHPPLFPAPIATSVLPSTSSSSSSTSLASLTLPTSSTHHLPDQSRSRSPKPRRPDDSLPSVSSLSINNSKPSTTTTSLASTSSDSETQAKSTPACPASQSLKMAVNTWDAFEEWLAQKNNAEAS
mmetsp:Transcript_33795/g.56767  ORF Transcript_33795/g.56767 Transcript_33795/m.56767 type:complete len:253 (-) Transcript_33795:2498-3256(-)